MTKNRLMKIRANNLRRPGFSQEFSWDNKKIVVESVDGNVGGIVPVCMVKIYYLEEDKKV